MDVGLVAPKPIATAVVGNSASIAPAESITEPGSTAELPLSTAAAEIECEEGDGKTVSAKRAWTEDEDKMLMETVEKFGAQRWSVIASHLVGRVGKQCRERWFNHLCPEVKKGEWTEEEDRLIAEGVSELGTKWSEIVKRLPGRTDNAIKNRYNSNQRRQLRMQRRAEAVAAGRLPPSKPGPPKAPKEKRKRKKRGGDEGEEGEGEEANCADGADEGAGKRRRRRGPKRKKAGDAEFSGTLFSGEGLSDDEGEEEGGAAQRKRQRILHLATQATAARPPFPLPLTHPTLPLESRVSRMSTGPGPRPLRPRPEAAPVTSSLLAPQLACESEESEKKDALIELLMRETIGSPQGQARWRPPDVASDDGVKTEALPSPTEIDLEQGVEELLARVQPRPAGALARSPSAEISRGLKAAVKSKSAEAAAAAVEAAAAKLGRKRTSGPRQSAPPPPFATLHVSRKSHVLHRLLFLFSSPGAAPHPPPPLPPHTVHDPHRARRATGRALDEESENTEEDDAAAPSSAKADRLFWRAVGVTPRAAAGLKLDLKLVDHGAVAMTEKDGELSGDVVLNTDGAAVAMTPSQMLASTPAGRETDGADHKDRDDWFAAYNAPAGDGISSLLTPSNTKLCAALVDAF